VAARLVLADRELELLPQNKTCGRCKKDKPAHDFGVHRNRSGAGYVLASYRRDCANQYARRFRKLAPPRDVKARWEQKLIAKYGVTADEYDSLLQSQNGACALCGATEGRVMPDGRLFRLFVDHDHKTGAVRGLLCSTCNSGIGQLGDDIEGLERALAYLKAATTPKDEP
jgi:hypothetical protein